MFRVRVKQRPPAHLRRAVLGDRTVWVARSSPGDVLEQSKCHCPWREQIKGELVTVVGGCDLDEVASAVATHARLYNSYM